MERLCSNYCPLNWGKSTLILWRKPFLIGDEIRSRNFEGTVEDINFRATQLRTFSGTRAVIPNSEIFANSLEVMTANVNRRVELIVGIGYQDSPEIAKRLVSNVLENMPRISTSRVYVTELAPSSVNLRIHFWTEAQQAKVLEVTDEVLTAIKQVLDEAGIDIPYPHNVVLLHNATRSSPNDTSRRPEPKWHDMDARDASK
jgi:small conductance mechanosensitive channel